MTLECDPGSVELFDSTYNNHKDLMETITKSNGRISFENIDSGELDIAL